MFTYPNLEHRHGQYPTMEMERAVSVDLPYLRMQTQPLSHPGLGSRYLAYPTLEQRHRQCLTMTCSQRELLDDQCVYQEEDQVQST